MYLRVHGRKVPSAGRRMDRQAAARQGFQGAYDSVAPVDVNAGLATADDREIAHCTGSSEVDMSASSHAEVQTEKSEHYSPYEGLEACVSVVPRRRCRPRRRRRGTVSEGPEVTRRPIQTPNIRSSGRTAVSGTSNDCRIPSFGPRHAVFDGGEQRRMQQ